MLSKPAACNGCPMQQHGEGFVPLQDVGTANLIVGEAPGEEERDAGKPFVGKSGQWLTNLLSKAKQNRDTYCIANTICCRPPGNVYPTDPAATSYISRQEGLAAVAHCRQAYLKPFLDSRNWQKIYALGNKAMSELTGRDGILLWRGSPLPLKDNPSKAVVIPTLHPSFLMRQANLISVVIKDLQKYPSPPPEFYNLEPTLDDVKAFKAKRFAFDFEWDWAGNITLCGLSDRLYHAIAVPWEGEFISELKRIFEQAEVLIGHNIIGADTRYIERLGWDISNARLVDTMLIQHLVQPDMRHGLAFVSSVFTNKTFWKGTDKDTEEGDSASEIVNGSQYKTWNRPNAIPRAIGGYGGCKSEEEAFRLYNARDTDASFQIAMPLENLLDRYQMRHVYEHISVPLGFICRDITEKGLKIDKTRLTEVREDLIQQIDEYDQRLPEGLRSFIKETCKLIDNEEGAYKNKTKICKGTKYHPHEPTEITFVVPGTLPCPICMRLLDSGKMTMPKKIKVPATERVFPWNSSQVVLDYAKQLGLKDVLHSKTKALTADKNARKIWARERAEFMIVDQLKQLVTLKNNFAKESLLKTDRMYYNILVHGTGEGRLSSTGKRRGIDLNVQNIPESMKKIFIPDREDWCFLDFDIGQGENKLTAWFAQDWDRLARLADPAYDEHSETASACFEVEVTKTNENKHLRKAGKIINHMLNYGAGFRKLQDVLAVQGFNISAAEAKQHIEAWRNLNATTYEWQRRTIKQVEQRGYLENPFGRRRWFQTTDLGPKALAFLPASTLADCVLRMMIAMHAERYGEHITALGLQASMNFPEPWRMVTQIHDSIVATGPQSNWQTVAGAMRAVMEQPWKELGGFAFTVDGKVCVRSLGESNKV
jgi:uracil-DNA glycosylase family 4